MGTDMLYQSEIFFEQWSKENYKVVDFPEILDGYCYIYFSGNGVYDPSTEAAFKKNIVDNDRYEWGRWKGKSQREIYVRDCFKAWYMNGINQQNNSVQNVYILLKELVKDFKVVTVGNSAGGYAAVLFGILLKAEKIYAFSAQFDIDSEQHLKAHKRYEAIKKECSQYFDLRPMLQTAVGEIYYFYPTEVADDVLQMELVKNIPIVHCFGIKSKLHGKAVYSNNLPQLLRMEEGELHSLCMKFENKKTHPFLFSIYLVALKRTLVGFFFNSIKPLFYKYNDFYRKLSRRMK